MKRIALAALLLGLFVYINPGLAQVGSKEVKVKYRVRDTGKETEITGIIVDESLEGISLKGGKKIPAEDVVDIEYPPPNFATGQELRKAQKAEKDRKLEDAIGIYKKMKTADKRFNQHMDYKVAYLTARMAESDPSQQQAAIDLLTAYMKNHPESWQIINFPKLLVPLQLKTGDTKGAEETIATLAKAKITDNLRQELNLQRTKIKLETKQYDEAEKELAKLIKEAKDPAQVIKFRMQRAECLAATRKLPQARAELQEILNKTNNTDIKAAALNTLGECLRKNGEAREAMWDFLFVDIIYNQNKDEHYRAIKNLAEVFDELKDRKKADQYKAMLKGK
jgi:tetratricopeptide (TPR) repeat protein